MTRLMSLFMAGSALWVGSVASAHAAEAAAEAPAAAAPGNEVDGVDQGDPSDIVVTGTLIRGIAPVGTETITVTQQDIKESGGRTVNDVLATVPQIANLFNTSIVPTPGQTRGLTQPAIHGLDTLILLDGHRIASAAAGANGGPTSIDPSIIPNGVLGGVEVVPDGGSALYGSDAVGGTINMNTIRRYDGVGIDASVTLGKAYTAFNAAATVGKAWSTGSIFAAYAYSEANEYSVTTGPLSSAVPSRPTRATPERYFPIPPARMWRPIRTLV